jgi:hypothetical protein
MEEQQEGGFKKPEMLWTKPKKHVGVEITTNIAVDDDALNISIDNSSENSTQDIKQQKESPEKEKLHPSPPPIIPKSREQILQEKQAKYTEILSSIKYHPPEGVSSFSADPRYSFEVLKNGTIVDRFKFSRLDNKGFYVVGRVPGCDVVAENPTVSRTHAILQFISCASEKNKNIKGNKDDQKHGKVGYGEAGNPDKTGLYLFDLNSTHGSYINKNQIIPHR